MISIDVKILEMEKPDLLKSRHFDMAKAGQLIIKVRNKKDLDNLKSN